jgi:hypothetical protein
MSDYLNLMTQAGAAFDSYDSALIESEFPVWFE